MKKLFLFVLIIIYVDGDERPLPDDQPGCDYSSSTMIFYENHNYYLKNRPGSNWICQESFQMRLLYCYTMYNIFCESKRVNSDCNITRDADTVERECKTRKLTFWMPASYAEADKHAWNVTLDINLFHCPITKMDLKFPRGDKPYEIQDFYIAEGRNEWTVAVLYNSTTSDNICVKNIYQPERNFIKQYFGKDFALRTGKNMSE